MTDPELFEISESGHVTIARAPDEDGRRRFTSDGEVQNATRPQPRAVAEEIINGIAAVTSPLSTEGR